MISKNYDKNVTLLILLLVIISSLGVEAKGLATQAEFPHRVKLKTVLNCFTHKFDFKLIEGKIWVKSRIPYGEYSDWSLLSGHGLPSKRKNARPYSDVFKIKEISADGENLIAIDQNDFVFYTKTHDWKWRDHFSVIPLTKKLKLPADRRAFGISHRGNYMKWYFDIDTNAHSVSAGVTTLYLLGKNGHTIYYADPWLPPKFSHIIDTPEKGSFIASNMAISGSTIFLINEAGEMYTRLYDYDTSGQNPVLAYSYKRENRMKSSRRMVRSLPNEDWKKQPEITGFITNSITIFQTGQGNSSFELRVEGKDSEGNSGFYAKPIYGPYWNFVKTGRPTLGKEIVTNCPKSMLYCSPKVKSYIGNIQRGKLRIEAKLLQFWPFSPPAEIRFRIGKRAFKANLHMRKFHKKKDGKIACAATIELPANISKDNTPTVKKVFAKLFKKSRFIDLVLVVDRNRVNCVEDLHIVGLAELADNIISLISKNGLSGELKAKFRKRLKMEFKEFR